MVVLNDPTSLGEITQLDTSHDLSISEDEEGVNGSNGQAKN